MGEIAPVFFKEFQCDTPIKKALFRITALGVYEATLNDRRIGEFILAPGWTSYSNRLQYQEYDVTDLVQEQNTLHVTVGKGWYRGRIPAWSYDEKQSEKHSTPAGLLAELWITDANGTVSCLSTDETWCVTDGPVRFSDLYDGEHFDATAIPCSPMPAAVFQGPFHTLIPQEGPEIRKQETLCAARIFTTPRGELVVDFGQEVTGYVITHVNGRAGEIVDLSFAEVLDKHGNFYTDNYRSAKADYRYICRDGMQTYEPKLTFWGFRYIRINAFPGGPSAVTAKTFQAVVLHSQMTRTGYLCSSNPLLNQLFDNIIWGQKSNFLDIPTDCPQRDERLGWTGDAQVFVRTAALNYDVEKFFTKWLGDLAADQPEDGHVSHVIPNCMTEPESSAAWGDAAAICPWQIYLAYGNPAILERQYESMCKWIRYITNATTTPYLWTGGTHFGDWLGLDAPSGSYKGSSREDFIASAYYAYSTELVIKAGNVLGRDVSQYEELYTRIVNAFREAFPVYKTQTECTLAVYFRLAEDPKAAADQLAAMVREAGTRLMTGFVGTPYLLHALSAHGYEELAYDLLLRTEYPSWLYPVTKGATTIWEHWDGIMETGDFWSADMNSFNHYAYGAVADWVYTFAAGICTVEEAPGYEKVRIAPHPDSRLDWLKAQLDTRHGRIESQWKKAGELWRYDITTPVDAEIVIAEHTYSVSAGTYCFYSSL